MKKILLFTTLIAALFTQANAQVGIGTTDPKSKLHVNGSLLVSQTVAPVSNTIPTLGQTMQNGLTQTAPSTQNNWRLYDPGGPSGNYLPSLTAYADMQSNSSYPGIELIIQSIGLGTGDSLIFMDANPANGGHVLMAVGNNYSTTGQYVFNTNQLYVTFKSNPDGSVGSGYDIVLRRMDNSTSATETVSPNSYAGNTFLFNATKGAVRSGRLSNTDIGYYSTAMGYNVIASGYYSTAMGSNTTASEDYTTAMGRNTIASGNYSTAIGLYTTASGNYSTAMGSNTMASGHYSTAMGDNDTASGNYSTAMGYNTTASGTASTAMGNHTTAQAYGSLVFGTVNVIAGNSSAWVASDPLLVAGNGVSTSSPSNALTLYKNGNLTIAGTLTQSSDARLKKDIQPLDNSLEKIAQLSGYHYHWKKDNTDARLQTGVIAQEVQKVMPELVTTNDNGDLTVNYNGITPYLIEGMKEQQKTIEDMKALIDKLTSRITLLESEKAVGKK